MTVLRVTTEPVPVSVADLDHDHADCDTTESIIDGDLHVWCPRHRAYMVVD
jgi:hypothetical protein